MEEDDSYEVENAPEETDQSAALNFRLPKPGDVLACDFRPEASEQTESGDISDATPTTTSTTTTKKKSFKVCFLCFFVFVQSV